MTCIQPIPAAVLCRWGPVLSHHCACKCPSMSAWTSAAQCSLLCQIGSFSNFLDWQIFLGMFKPCNMANPSSFLSNMNGCTIPPNGWTVAEIGAWHDGIVKQPGQCLKYTCSLTSIGIPIIKIKQSHSCLNFIMGISMHGKTVFILRQTWGHRQLTNFCLYSSAALITQMTCHHPDYSIPSMR